jgi:hypothetical protein
MKAELRGYLIGGTIAIGAIIYLQLTIRDQNSLKQEAAAAPVENTTNDFYLSQGPAEQAQLLGEASGKCDGERAFFMGLDQNKIAFWSLRCQDGRSFMVSVYPDRKGSAMAMECGLLNKLRTGRKCFRPLPSLPKSSARLSASEGGT